MTRNSRRRYTAVCRCSSRRARQRRIRGASGFPECLTWPTTLPCSAPPSSLKPKAGLSRATSSTVVMSAVYHSNEPRLFHQFDHRWATYNSCDTRDLSPAEKDGSEVLALPHYWVPADEITIRLANKWRHSWLLGFRNITNSTNERTIICSHLPLVAVGHNALLLFFEDMVSEASSYIGANLNSFILDYCARQKLMSASVNYFNLKQFPILPPQ